MDKPGKKPLKFGKKRGRGQPFTKDDPRINRTMPGPGRPPDEFRAMCQALACSAQDAAIRILEDDRHPAFGGALKWATEHGYGKPKESIELTGKDGGPIQVWTIGGKEVAF